MFDPKTEKIGLLAKDHPAVIAELSTLLEDPVHMYIDYANVRPWSERLHWHIDMKRLKQFLGSFSTIHDVKFYCGTLEGDERSEQDVSSAKEIGYTVRTKPVKIMQLSVNASSLSGTTDTSLLKKFVRKALLRRWTGEVIEYLNKQFFSMNTLGTLSIEDRKCNFDVEIGTDMLLDSQKEKVATFVLWSGDSDFHDALSQLLSQGKKVILFATSRRIAKELNDLRSSGLLIFDIQKIRDLICWNKEIPHSKGENPKGPPSSRVSDH